MLPHYNTFQQNSGQANLPGVKGGSSAPSPQQQPQGMPFNPSRPNYSNMLPPSMGPQPGFMNLPNGILPMQNNMFMPMSPFGSLGSISQQGHPAVGFSAPQGNAHNMNMTASYPFNGQFCNMAQTGQVNPNMGFLPGQLFAQNLLNLQQMNQSIGAYGQFCLPNMLNRNQVLPIQMLNPGQGGPNAAYGGANQAVQASGPQNHAPFATPNFGNVQSPNQAGQQMNQNQQNSGVQGTQGNHIKAAGVYNSNSDRKTLPNKRFLKHPKQGGFQNSQFHQNKNAKGKFAYPNRENRNDLSNGKEGKYAHANSMDQSGNRKRSLSLSYTEQEVQLWREGRRKNYPSSTNIEKKLNEKMLNSEAIQREAEARKQQLKEVLAKQAEMGVEVAEIPSHYLSDSEKQGNRREDNRSWKNNHRSQNKIGKRDRYNKKDRFAKQAEMGVEVAEIPSHYLSDSEKQGNRREDNRSWKNNHRSQNKIGKRDRYNKKDRFAKRQRSNQNNSSNDPAFSKREPTLLQKLLSSDISRDKSRLQQVFRFMVTNSFFKDFPDQPLKFPSVVIKETVEEKDVVEESSSVSSKDAYGGHGKSMVEVLGNTDYKDCSYNDLHNEDDDEDDSDDVTERPEGEEGEIII